MVILEVEAVNNNKDTNAIYTEQGIIVTDTGHQIKTDLFFSDDVGSDFHGEVTKTADIFFFFDDDSSSVKNIRFIVNSAYDKDYPSYREVLEFSINSQTKKAPLPTLDGRSEGLCRITFYIEFFKLYYII